MRPSPINQVRWSVHRAAAGLAFRIETPDLEEGIGGEVLLFKMNQEEAWALVHGTDRVMSYGAASADGTFTPMPTGSQARQHLTIARYLVTSPGIEIHTAMVAATAWATWVECVDAPVTGISWHVDVFAGDDANFLQIALTHGVRVTPLDEAAEVSADD